MQSTLVRVGCLGRNCDYEGIHFDHESYEQPSPPSTIHPALFSLEDRISHGGQVPSNRTPTEVYTDGSKINDQTGNAFCAIANEAITKTWKAKLSPASTVFQAEMLALKAAIEWTNTANEDVNIWSDSESSLQALKSFNVKSKIIQEAQMTLLENVRIRLGWVKAHIGIKCNEIADTLSKEATTDGIPASLPFPKSFLKKQLLQLSLSRWQAEWDNVTFKFRFEAARVLFWDRPRNFQPRSDDEDDAWALPSLSFSTTPGGARLTPSKYGVYQDLKRGGSSVESVFGPGGLKLRSRDFTIRPPSTY
ncbi:hypothetical protein AVEN_53410-1 [Araneus ventricosus]|uniref:RNase H type-1 domain-containing protein n=1 Tax=Araneus ventricosus TaxID=182803 RepID=A0A4Y2ABN2_ARAVE|nr:hypothetical protein AVEN_53410-1 [Araneus ventricosus]